MMPSMVFGAEVSGNGTEADPYVVSTEQELMDALTDNTNNPGEVIKLNNDITINAPIDVEKEVVIDGAGKK